MKKMTIIKYVNRNKYSNLKEAISILKLQKIEKPAFRKAEKLSPLLLSCFVPKKKNKKKTALIDSCIRDVE